MKKNLFLSLCALVALLLSSCSSNKDIVYLADMEQGKQYIYDTKYEAIVHKNDRLSISVSCKRPELAIPFNSTNSVQVAADGSVATTSGNDDKGYRVDADGCIDFPILGKLHVDGLKVSEVCNLIEEKIKEANYIKDPQVSMEFLNFKYTVLGAVGNVGTYTVADDRITIIEAIANAGDLTKAAKMDRVAVIREIDGKREIFFHDIRSTEIFTSPCFYLQQNDIVYVEPKYIKEASEDKAFKYATLLVSIASLCSTLIWALK